MNIIDNLILYLGSEEEYTLNFKLEILMRISSMIYYIFA